MKKRPWIPRKSRRTGFSFDRTNVEDISTVMRIPMTVDLKAEEVIIPHGQQAAMPT